MMYSSLNSGTPVEFSHCEKNEIRLIGGCPFRRRRNLGRASFSNSFKLAFLPSYFL